MFSGWSKNSARIAEGVLAAIQSWEAGTGSTAISEAK